MRRVYAILITDFLAKSPVRWEAHMTRTSRREFLKVATVGAASATLGWSASAAADPVLGMIFPPANTPVPPEAHLMYPTGVRFLATGVGLERMTPEGYDQVFDRIVPAAQKLAGDGANAISVMGTSLTFYKGAAYNQQLQEAIKKATGLPATTMSTAIVEGLKAVGGRRLAVATAYNEEVSQRLRTFLEESGFEVLVVKGMGIERFEDRPPVTPEELLNFSAGVWETAPKADALLVSCGALKTLELLAPLEQRCKVPVVSSLPHALWASVRLLGLSGRAPGYGSLLSRG
jgi:arylmalonate decarboxylase